MLFVKKLVIYKMLFIKSLISFSLVGTRGHFKHFTLFSYYKRDIFNNGRTSRFIYLSWMKYWKVRLLRVELQADHKYINVLHLK